MLDGQRKLFAINTDEIASMIKERIYVLTDQIQTIEAQEADSNRIDSPRAAAALRHMKAHRHAELSSLFFMDGHIEKNVELSVTRDQLLAIRETLAPQTMQTVDEEMQRAFEDSQVPHEPGLLVGRAAMRPGGSW